jgi:hypothetical protein
MTNITLAWNPVNDASGIEAYNYQMSSRADFPANFIQFRGSVSGTSSDLYAARRTTRASIWDKP